jgi:ATP-dependent DNA helicase RecG
MLFRLKSKNNLINISIFKRAFLKNKLLIGTDVIVIGKYDKKRNTIIASDIKFGVLGNVPIIEPVYHLTHGLTTKQLNSIIREALILDNNYFDYIPSKYLDKYKFLNKEKSLNLIHGLTNNQDLIKQARLRLKYEELFIYMLKMNYLKINNSNKLGITRNVDFNKVEELINKLPFKLTTDQLKGIKEIYEDMNSKYVMNRLIQGDVGSGKTIVSFIALYINYLSGYQGALMAPTEVLAHQHLINLKNIFKEELEEKSNVQKMHIPKSDKSVTFYNLDVIILVGYRVKSKQGIAFRKWASKILKDYMLKGYAINEQD